MHVSVAEVNQALAADGDATGIITITDNTVVYPSAKGYLTKADGSVQQYVVVTERVSTNKVGIRFIPEDQFDPKLRSGSVKLESFGKSDCTPFPTGSFLCLPQQVVRVYPNFTALPRSNPA